MKNNTTLQQQFTDHDLIIRVDTKQDAMAQDIKDLKDGMSIQLTKNTARIDKIEKRQEEIFTSLKVIRWSLGILSAIVLAIIGIATDIVRIFIK